MGRFCKLAMWAGFCLSTWLVAGCGGAGDDKTCSGTVFYNSYSYASAPSGEVGIPYSYMPSISISGCRPSDRVSAGSLPPGLSLDPGSGRISGVPTQGGSYTLTIQPNASGSVQSTFTLNVYPIGVQTAALTVERTAAAALGLHSPSSDTTRSIAAVDHGAGWVLYSMDQSIFSHFQLETSNDMGLNWNPVTHVGGPSPTTSASGTHLAGGPHDLYVLDTADTNAVLYRYDGSAWHVVNNTLPFPSVRTAGFHVDASGEVIVAWIDSAGVVMWRSADGGVSWARSMATSVRSASSPQSYDVCIGTAGADLRLVARSFGSGDYSGPHVDLRLSSGAAAWDDYGFWVPPIGLENNYTDLSIACASARSRFWIHGVVRPDTTPQYLAMFGAGEGSLQLDFPVRIPNAPPMKALASMGPNLVGLTRYSWGSPWEIWVFR